MNKLDYDYIWAISFVASIICIVGIIATHGFIFVLGGIFAGIVGLISICFKRLGSSEGGY